MSRPIRLVVRGRNTMTDQDADASLHPLPDEKIPRAAAILQVAPLLFQFHRCPHFFRYGAPIRLQLHLERFVDRQR